ncbi:MAG: class I SAM-dependent methyltransferase [Flexilinea sp.]|nr:class I SAM-dependent methyltransferase [Flexilinea sp.]
MDRPDLSRLDARYSLQMEWTRPLREYICRKLPRGRKLSILEVGSGTGAVVRCLRSELSERAGLIAGVDRDPEINGFAAQNGGAEFITANGEQLPFGDGCFDFVYCHYLLLWTKDPAAVLREMRRVTVSGGICAALAEPCYAEMEAAPEPLYELACRQREALAAQGADPRTGRELGRYFREAGFRQAEFGAYEKGKMTRTFLEREIARMAEDTGLEPYRIPQSGPCYYFVPTYYAFAVK